MRFATSLKIGPIGFRVGSDGRGPVSALDDLYRDYPKPDVADFTVRLRAARPWRRWIRPSIVIDGDHSLPEAAPLPLAQGLLAAELAMNLQMALGQRRFLLLHAATLERGGRALIVTGESGAGKSTLATLLAAQDWRLMGDEFALVDPATGLLHAFPRLVSLKNAAIGVAEAAWPAARFGPLLRGTPKGDIRHLVPDARAIEAMAAPAIPALILFPSFGQPEDCRSVPPSEAFVRLTQASTNFVALGERGFAALTGLVTRVPAIAIDYPDSAVGLAAVAREWAAA